MIRAFQWDLARQVERLDWLLEQLPRYADWGYQELYLHFEDAVEYPSLPGVARQDAYSMKELEKLSREALKVGIRTVPIANLLGHTQYLIKVPELRELNELVDQEGRPLEKGQICPLHPRTIEVAECVLRDLKPLCSAGKVHLGLDESFQLGRHPLSREEVKRAGLAAHFAGHVQRLHALADKLGLKSGLWADMLALLPEAIPLLPRGMSAYDWYYYPFEKLPRLELRNFASYDLSPALKKQGISYWACPMNGAFRYEPLPVFGERLANIRSWWHRAQTVGAEGFLVTSWESYRLAQEMTTVVDAAAACLWLNPEVEDHAEMLARGFARVFGKSHCHRLSRQALACDERAFAGYARWETNDHWDASAPREGYGRQAAEARFFERLSHQDLPEAFAASAAFRLYLARRDVFVRKCARELLQLRRQIARNHGGKTPRSWNEIEEAGHVLRILEKETASFARALAEGKKAALTMWKRTRGGRGCGQNGAILERDKERLRSWSQFLRRLLRKPALALKACPLLGEWQLQMTVHNPHPALQRVVVEQQDEQGQWHEIRGRYTIEFRAAAARPKARVRRELSMPISCDAKGRLPLLRVAVRGLGFVDLGQVELVNGVKHLRPAGWGVRERKRLGLPAPEAGWPEIDMTVNRGLIELDFRTAMPSHPANEGTD